MLAVGMLDLDLAEVVFGEGLPPTLSLSWCFKQLP